MKYLTQNLSVPEKGEKKESLIKVLGANKLSIMAIDPDHLQRSGEDHGDLGRPTQGLDHTIKFVRGCDMPLQRGEGECIGGLCQQPDRVKCISDGYEAVYDNAYPVVVEATGHAGG